VWLIMSNTTGAGSKGTPTHATHKGYKLIMAGAVSGAVTKTAIAPLERVKVLHQVQGMSKDPALQNKYRGIGSTLKTVIAEEGVLGLYKGNGANVMRIVPTYGLKFAFNDTFREMFKTYPGQTLSAPQLMAAGTAAGLFQITITYPLDVVRTRLTLSESVSGGVQYKGIADCARSILRSEGLSAAYKGIGPTWLSGAPYVGLQMSFYELSKSTLFPEQDESKLVAAAQSMACGALSGVAAQSVTFPGDTVRRRMQTNGIGGSERAYHSSADCIGKMLRNEGVGSFFRGLQANTLRCVPGAAIQFYVYDSMKQALGA
jgi:hypothetical protein